MLIDLIAGARLNFMKIAQLEAGIRLGDWTMPLEINKQVKDSISNFFYTASETASQNLREMLARKFFS